MPPLPIAEYRHDDQTRRPDFPFQRDWIRRGGRAIAFVEWGQLPHAFHPQKYDVRIYVDPAHDAAGVRPFYLDHLLQQLRGRDVIALTSGMLENCAEAMRFFDAYGFVEVAREEISSLDLTTWDAAAFAGRLARVQQQGIRIVPLRALQAEDPDGWQRRLFELDTAISRDIPSTGEKQPHTFESWRQARITGPAFDPDGWFVALDGDRYVGQSQGYLNPAAPDLFENRVTGVLRDYRRRGIATAVKVHLLRYAQQRGARSIVTGNDANNPMYRLNLQLGFRPEPAWVRVEKALAPARPATALDS
jgi:GNAT superfamily N-acetyltransferase